MNLNIDFTSFTKINSKWVTDLDLNTKLQENNLGENLDDFRCGDLFLDTTPKTHSMKEIVDKLDFTKIRNFCSAKDSIKNEKINHRQG